MFISNYCFAQEEQKIPDIKKLEDFPKTEFVPTLEHPLNKDKNCIYAASLLYAWDEIRKAVGEPILIDKKYKDLTLINDSKSHVKTLKPNEYTSSVKFENNSIIARSEFKKSLPFQVKLKDLHSKSLIFDNLKVHSFGLTFYEKEILESFSILYYKDDNNFIIKLIPIDKEHEIILFKSSLDSNPSLLATIDSMNEYIEKGKKEMVLEDLKWCYEFQIGNKLVIPKLKFNIEHDYNNLANNYFGGKSGLWYIIKATQKTAFEIDQNGAKIKSEAELILGKKKKQEIEKPIQKIKIMMFDKPFLLLMKRVDNKNPYFAMWVANAELMEKEDL